MKRNKTRQSALRRFLSLLLCFVLAAGILFSPAVADEDSESAESGASSSDSYEALSDGAEYEEVYIETAEDLLELASSCRLDSWSLDKKVVLLNDIDLGGAEFEPVASFGGIFYGGGFTISGLVISESSPMSGLFACLTETAYVTGLNISGSITPDGTVEAAGGIAAENYGVISDCAFSGTVSGSENSGGIAGINGETGEIINCTSDGAVAGKSGTGGIAGTNLGIIRNCRNEACVNVTSGDETVSLTDLDLSSGLSVDSTAEDTGGIAGYNAGTIQGCENTAVIGYPHVGYNVGGIAGRSCGYILDCENSGYVQGRKDVGGIAGQIEPYISSELSASAVQLLEAQTDTVYNDAAGALENADSVNSQAAERLEALLDDLDELSDALADFTIDGTVSGSATGIASADGTVSAEAEAGDVDISADIDGDGDLDVDISDPSVSISTSSDNSSSITTDGDFPGLDFDTSEDNDITFSVSAPDVDVDGDIDGDVDVNIDPDTSTADIDAGGTAEGTVDASADITVTTSMYEVTSALNSVTNEIRLMEDEISAGLYSATDELRDIIDGVYGLADTFADSLENAGSSVTDTSAENIASVTLGKTTGCTNSGTIYGDINSGGIAGSMAIEYTLDPEDDLSADLTSAQRTAYELKAIITDCENNGSITSRRDCAGGICGMMQLGIITDCENYGPVQSENGEYVGGIAGETASTVRSCYVKCTLTGGSIVGGIVGSGTEGDTSDESSLVSGNLAMVEISGCSEYYGAVSGMDAGEFLENYFVSDTLSGISGLSRAGSAEPITYEELCLISGLPEEFLSFTLTFTADDEILKTVSFNYGDSFDADVYPEIPEKEGYYGEWDIETLVNLRFDTVVDVVYTQYVTSLTTDDKRDDGRSVFYILGDFTESDEAEAEALTQTPSEFGTLSDSLGGAVASYFEKLGSQSWTEAALNRDVLEQWYLVIPDDGSETHEIRYLASGGKTDNLDVYIKNGGDWELLETDVMGSYLTFYVSGNTAEIAILSVFPMMWAWILLAVLVIIIILLVLILIVRSVRKRKKSARAENNGSPEDKDSGDAPARLPDAEQEMALLQGVPDEECGPDNTEAAVLNETGGEIQVSGEKSVQAAPADGKKSRKKHTAGIVIGLLAAVIVILLIIIFFIGSAIYNALGISGGSVLESSSDNTAVSDGGGMSAGTAADNLLTLLSAWDELGSRDVTAADMVLSADLGPLQVSETLEYYNTVCDGTDISSVQKSGLSIYFTEDTVCDEDGNVLSSSDSSLADSADLISIAYELCANGEFSCKSSGNSLIFTMSLDEDGMEDVILAIAPDAADLDLGFTDGEVTVTVCDGVLESISVSVSGTITIIVAETDISASALISFSEEETDFTVPEPVIRTLAE